MSLAVLGGSAFARHLAREPGAALLDRVAHEGSWLARRVDPDTGEGIRAALLGADRLVVVLDGPAELMGLYLVLRPDETPRRYVLVVPPGVTPPSWISQRTDWAILTLGYPFGPGEPLHDAVKRGGRVPDVGAIPVVPLAEARAVVLAALDQPGARWTWAGEPRRLRELAGVPVGRAWWTSRWARRAGLDPGALAAWAGRPGGPQRTPGFDGSGGSSLVGDAART